MSTVSNVQEQKIPIRAQIALCSVISFIFSLLYIYAPDLNKIFVLVIMGAVCGTLLDIPKSLPLRRIAFYCMIIQISLLIGLIILYLIRSAGTEIHLLEYFTYYFALPLVAYPILVICCLARPATVALFSRGYKFVLSARKSGFQVGWLTKLVLAGILSIIGVSQTHLVDVIIKIWS